MGTYYIPRNVKGESRILYIFTVKSLITTTGGGIIGILFYFLFSSLNMKMVGIIIAVIITLIGFGIGAIKIPNAEGLRFTKKVGGEELSEIILRYARFKKNRKIYLYTEEKEEKE